MNNFSRLIFDCIHKRARQRPVAYSNAALEKFIVIPHKMEVVNEAVNMKRGIRGQYAFQASQLTFYQPWPSDGLTERSMLTQLYGRKHLVMKMLRKSHAFWQK